MAKKGIASNNVAWDNSESDHNVIRSLKEQDTIFDGIIKNFVEIACSTNPQDFLHSEKYMKSALRALGDDFFLDNYNENLVFVGDSITAGSLGVSHTLYTISYSNGFYNLPDSFNRAIGGQTTQDVLDSITAIAALNPSVTVCFAGGNDLIQGIDFETVKSNLRSIYDYIISIGSKVIASTFFNLRDDILSEQSKEDMDKLNRWLRSQTDIILVDNTRSINPEDLREDGIHLNYEGATKFGKSIANSLNVLAGEAILPTNKLATESLNPTLSGTSGAISGATGDVADSWVGVTDTDAPVIFYKEDGAQVFEVIGTNTVADARIIFRVDVPNNVVSTDMYATMDVEIENNTGIPVVGLTYSGATQNTSVPEEELPSGFIGTLRTETVAAGATTIRLQLVVNLNQSFVSGKFKLRNPFIGEIV